MLPGGRQAEQERGERLAERLGAAGELSSGPRVQVESKSNWPVWLLAKNARVLAVAPELEAGPERVRAHRLVERADERVRLVGPELAAEPGALVAGDVEAREPAEVVADQRRCRTAGNPSDVRSNPWLAGLVSVPRTNRL